MYILQYQAKVPISVIPMQPLGVSLMQLLWQRSKLKVQTGAERRQRTETTEDVCGGDQAQPAKRKRKTSYQKLDGNPSNAVIRSVCFIC